MRGFEMIRTIEIILAMACFALVVVWGISAVAYAIENKCKTIFGITSGALLFLGILDCIFSALSLIGAL